MKHAIRWLLQPTMRMHYVRYLIMLGIVFLAASAVGNMVSFALIGIGWGSLARGLAMVGAGMGTGTYIGYCFERFEKRLAQPKTTEDARPRDRWQPWWDRL